MKLNKPFMISARLLPGLQAGDAWISMKFDGLTDDHRAIYHYFIDHPDFEYENCDIRSGVGGGTLQEGFSSLLSFLGHDAEKYRSDMQLSYDPAQNLDDYCFDSVSLIEWAYSCSEELEMLALELEENNQLIED